MVPRQNAYSGSSPIATICPQTWLAYLNAALDGVVWTAYSWGDLDPAATSDETIPERLLELNQ